MCKMFENSRCMQYLSAITATLSMASAATYAFWPSPSLPILQSENSPMGRPISDEEGSWVVSLYKLATVPSALLAALLIERIGRKNTLFLGGILQFIPWLMIVFGKTLTILYIARFIAGIGTGIALIVCSIYNGEIAENDIRGKLGTSLIVLKWFGSILILCIGPYVSYTNLALLSSTIPILFMSFFMWMPETPYYLTKINKGEKAAESLRLLSSRGSPQKFLSERMNEIENCVEDDMQNETTLWEFIRNREYGKAIIIIIGTKTLHHLSGDAAIDAYMQPIIESSDVRFISAGASSMIFGLIQLPPVLTSTLLVDKLGRKPLLITSSVGCAVALFALGMFFYLQDFLKMNVSSISWLPVAGIALFLLTNPIGVETIPYVLLGELFPTNIKGIAVSISILYGGVLSFLVLKFFKPLANVCGVYSVFWAFGLVCILGAVFVWIIMPETKGKSFSEIKAVLNK